MSVPMNSDRELENAFKQIITAGWAMKSDGDVEAPSGYFAKIPIASNEMQELVEAVFDGEQPEGLEPGYYLTREDSAGNIWIWKYDNKFLMDSHYSHYEREYSHWRTPEFVLRCFGCDKTFTDIQEAHEHGVVDLNTKSWCGDAGFKTEEQVM